MELLNIVTTIVKIGGKIKSALETVKHNEELCSDIRDNVGAIADVLSSAENNTKIMAAGMSRSLCNLRNAMEKALNLIRDCQEKSRLALFLTVDQISQKLHHANHKIIHCMGIAQFAMTSLQPAPSMEYILFERKGNEDVEEREEKENLKGRKKKQTRENVEEKTDGPGLVRPEYSSAEDPYDSSREEEKEDHYSRSSSCSVPQLTKAMIKNLLKGKTILGQVGDDILYKVNLRDGAPAMTYRFRDDKLIALAENDIRVRGMAKVEHIHILKHLGYAYHGGFFYMVQEHSIGTLHHRIHGEELSWQQCSNIILGIADGVFYLHERGVIHMSLNPREISIVPECVAKITNFYFSETLTGSAQEGVVTTSREMEKGFAPPEYRKHGRFSVKTDVYSYGVLLLELINRQMYNKSGANCKSLHKWVLQHALENNMIKCIPPRFADGPHVEGIKRCIRIALACVKKDPAKRPTMGDVVRWLRKKNQAYNTQDTVTERDVDTPPTTTSMPTDRVGSGAPRLRGGDRATGPTHGMIEPKTAQEGSTARKSKKSRMRKSSKYYY